MSAITLMALLAVIVGPAEDVDASSLQAPRTRGYLNLSPGVMAIGGDLLGYAWGAELGVHFTSRRYLTAQFGFVFNDITNGRPGHLLGFGPQVRLGGWTSDHFSYALFGIGAGVFPGSDTRWMLRTSIGGGLLRQVHRHVTVGGELTLELHILRVEARTRVMPAGQLRLFIGFLF